MYARFRAIAPVLTALALAASCHGDDGPGDTAATPTTPATCAESALTWTNFGHGFVENWCTGCHSIHITGDRRQGAPPSVNFDTYDEVVQWSALMDQLIDGGDPPMPPAGGIPDDQLADFHEWVACGLPGGTTPEVALCDQPRAWFNGDVTVGSAGDVADFCGQYTGIQGSLRLAAGDVAALAGCLCEVTGDLTVETDAAGSQELTELRAIGGRLAIDGTTALASLRFPRLETVGGDVDVRDNAALADLYLEELTTVGGPIAFVDNPVLASIGLGKVTGVPSGDLTVTGNDAATWLEVSRMTSIAGNLLVSDDAALERFTGTDNLLTIGGDVTIADLPALVELSNFEYVTSLGGDLTITGVGTSAAPFHLLGWNALTTVAGSIRVVGNPGFDHVYPFNNLADLGGELEITDNPILTEIPGFLRLETIGSAGGATANGLTIARNAKLTDYSGLYALKSVGGLVIQGNPALTAAAGFGDLATVTHDLVIDDNDKVSSLLGYLALTTVGGDLVVTNNLTLDAVDGFSALKSVGGTLRFGFDRDLATVSGFDTLTSAGGLVIESQTSLTTLALPALTSIGGDLRLANQAVMTTAPALGALDTVGGDLEISGNAALADLDPWAGIDTVGGDLRIVDNLALPTSEADDLLAAIGAGDVGGTVEISGNAP